MDRPVAEGQPTQRELKQSAKRWREMLASEREAAALYDGLAGAESGERADILRELAAVERRHAAHWESRLREAGFEVPAPVSPVSRFNPGPKLATAWSITA